MNIRIRYESPFVSWIFSVVMLLLAISVPVGLKLAKSNLEQRTAMQLAHKANIEAVVSQAQNEVRPQQYAALEQKLVSLTNPAQFEIIDARGNVTIWGILFGLAIMAGVVVTVLWLLRKDLKSE